MNTTKKQMRDATAKAAEQAANEGHYLDRLENIAIALEDRESVMAVHSLRQLHAYCNSQPTGSLGMQLDISLRLLIIAERDWKFTRDQLNRLWYGVHWDAAKAFKLKFPYEKKTTFRSTLAPIQIRSLKMFFYLTLIIVVLFCIAFYLNRK